ncbi:hypothetical protein C2845_PM01G31660 [Panicum miliaceum]|uniref:Uncharacterized protein n=1 Tax=Panicum miliaceum TaxID=4540 RepID=A0A3L6TJX1_PANMI|nr:hypothetical protein C2845_PM01G31660 [Panicum miliaceum]
MPMPALLVLVLVVLCGLPASWMAAAAPANPGDAAAMLGLANWTGAGSSLGWPRAGLGGVLRESDLGSLSFLEELDLSFNSLTTPTGSLPLLPTPLQHLRALDLRSNRFIDIPEGFFAGFPALEMVAIDDNPMAAPELRLDVLTASAGLRSFSANNIGLLRNFPDFFGNPLVFPALETLSLARNEMIGRIPASFGNNSRIKYLDISGQVGSSEVLVGRIDQFIPGMKSLVEVRMDRNGFLGPLPDATKLANLRVFSDADNLCGVSKFAGSVSVDLKGNPHVSTPC